MREEEVAKNDGPSRELSLASGYEIVANASGRIIDNVELKRFFGQNWK